MTDWTSGTLLSDFSGSGGLDISAGQPADYQWSMNDLYNSPSMTASLPSYSNFDGTSFAPNYNLTQDYTPQNSVDLSSYFGTGEPNMAAWLPSSISSGSAEQAVSTSPWTTALNNLIASPDAMVKLGLGGLGAIGNAYSQSQTNKMNKKAMKSNAKYDAYRAAMMDRAQKNAAIADKYNNSYDTTTAAKANYTPLTREQAMTYGETGAPHQQIDITPGVTTRNYLAEGGLPHGGQADTIDAKLSEGEFVVPADVVSILGDGNTRAGGSALQQMMQQIRAGAGRTNTKSIPAKAKPATAYLKGKK